MTSSRNFINITNKYDRVVLLVDMDCFYCQVEEKLDPNLAGKPVAVVQYNEWRGGGIIAVNYAARAKGVTRHMRGDEAKTQCPDIMLVKVPNVREKADLTKYREAGKEVARVLQKFTSLLERASVDEAYLDITAEVNKRMENMDAGTFLLEPEKLSSTYAVGYDSIGEYIGEITAKISQPCDDDEYSLVYDVDDTPAVRKSDLRLLIGAAISSEIRAAVKNETTYECSAGIAHNKILAKLACGMNKPNKQTVLPLSQINALFRTLPVHKIKGLGAKFGEEVCERLQIKFLGDLLTFSEADLQRKLDEKSGSWIYLLSRGIDLEAVTPRFYSKSIGCCKKFPGRNSITGLKTLEHWLTELANEIADRLEKDVEENNRRAKQMVVSYMQEINSEDVSSSRSSALASYEPEGIQRCALEVLKRNTDQFFKPGSDFALNNPIKFLGISVGKFESISSGAQNTLQLMFANQKKKEPRVVSTPAEKDTNITTTADKTNLLQTMFANQKAKEPTINHAACAEKSAKLAPKSFFAAHLNKIKQQKQDESFKLESGTESNDLYCNETISEQSQGEVTSLNSSVKPSDLTGASKSFFAKALKANSPVKEAITLKIEQQSPEEASTSHSKPPSEVSCAKLADSKSHSPKASKSFFAKTSHTNTPLSEPISLKRKQESPPVASTSRAEQAYLSSYVELATPELREEFFTKCETCGQSILCDDAVILCHQDRHVAEELSRQQREEYRKEIQSKVSQTSSQKKSKPLAGPSVSKKMKPNSPKIACDIKKFMAPLTQCDGPSTSAQVTCDRCGRSMHRDLMPEHLDYHFARDLQLNLNKSEMVTVASKVTQSPNVVKKNNSGGVPSSKSKPISQFFTQL